MFPNLIVVVELHDVDARPSNRKGKYVYKERDVPREGESKLAFWETRYHVGGSGTPAISYLRKWLGKWAVEPKLLHDFRSAEEKEEVDIVVFFFLSFALPIKTTTGWQRRKGCGG